jgi:O-acetyl-ADP-ribose deacetylase (regulator of RNase III)
MKFSIYLGDIADAAAEALCTSTNPRLSLMMGTGASIRARGGPEVMRACEGLAPRDPGTVHVTMAGALPHKAVIHCVASDAAHHSSVAVVRSCVAAALAAADASGCTTVATPILGTGHARLRFADAVRAMAQTAMDASTHVREVKFVTNDEERVDELRTILQEMPGTAVEVERSAKVTAEPDSLWSEEYGLHFDMP